ncbi:MAG: TPM domain-containing protein [Candidatus Latescibacteria bacterium]|nr:TPM domain-containing protein [Candidatus Latescibacterota bacterium]
MKALLVLALCLLPLAVPALEVPPLRARVNDTAGLLSPSTATLLESLLKAHEDSTSNQVTLLTIPSLEGEDLEGFSMRVAEAWKPGQAKKDNGVLLLVARDDREVRIEVGGGLEGALPDITCGRIIRNEIVPRFREGDYDGGILHGTGAILAAIGGVYPAEAPAGEGGAAGKGGDEWWGLVLVGLFVFLRLVKSALFTSGLVGWLVYLVLVPVWVVLGVVVGGVIGIWLGLGLAGLLIVGLGVLRLIFSLTGLGRRWSPGRSSGRRGGQGPIFWGALSGGSGRSSGGFSGGFSGGGGSVSGGGASGKW